MSTKYPIGRCSFKLSVFFELQDKSGDTPLSTHQLATLPNLIEREGSGEEEKHGPGGEERGRENKVGAHICSHVGCGTLTLMPPSCFP